MWCIISVWPSGRADATRPAAMVPPAPVTFSTTTGWPRSFAMPSATMREITSVGPPAENGTTIVTGRLGKGCCARRAAGAASASGMAAAAAASKLRRCIGVSSFILSWLLGWLAAP